jgi:sugar lactone lactonase YvrE
VEYSKSTVDEIWATHKWISTGTKISVLGLTKTPLKYIVATKIGFAYVDLTCVKGDGELVKPENAQIIHMSPDDSDMRFNDGFVDPHGRFMAGSMFDFGFPANNRGKLYRFDPTATGDDRIEVLADNCTIPNGIAFSPDNKIMYFVDSLTFNIYQYDYNLTSGELSNRRLFVHIDMPEFASPEPDGLCTSDDGSVWVAVWSTSMVRRFSAQGELLEIYQFPAERISCTAFAGKNMDELIVTTAHLHLDDPKKCLYLDSDSDKGGEIFRVKIDGVKGLPRNVMKI